jgi:hypothetical protein
MSKAISVLELEGQLFVAEILNKSNGGITQKPNFN